MKLAAALTAAGREDEGGSETLNITGLQFADGDKMVTVMDGPVKYRCDLSGKVMCGVMSGVRSEEPGGGRNSREMEVSPDRTKVAFIRDWNLWVRDLQTGKETQLTTDGVKDFGYATDNAGWTHSDNADHVVVAGLEEDCDVSAGPAQGWRDVPDADDEWASGAKGLEVSAGGRQGCHDDRAGDYQCGFGEGGAVEDAA